MRVVLFGAPGSGKGTQARLIVKKYDIPQISLSELLRNTLAEGSSLGLQARAAVDHGGAVPDELLISIIRERISRPDASNGFILDGFPENLVQAQGLDHLLQLIGRPLNIALLLDTDFDALMQRITGRRTCLSCGHVCNIYTDPPKMDGQCDECGGNLRHRVDDNEEIISNRYRLYETQNQPIIDYYKEQGKLRIVQGIGEVDDIFAAISHILDEVEVDADEALMPTLEELEEMILSKAQKAQVDDEEGSYQEETGVTTNGNMKVAARKKTTSKAVAVKTTAKKATAKKATAKKATAKKATAKKATAKKATAKKATAKKATAKKATAKKATAKKATAKKATAKKATQKKKR